VAAAATDFVSASSGFAAAPSLPSPLSEVVSADADAPIDGLRRLGARVHPWSATPVIGPRGVRCGVDDGVSLSRGPTGVRWNRPVQATGTFALRLVSFEQIVQEEAQRIFGTGVARIEHLGSYVCRPVRGSSGSPSEHARGDAVDVAAFVLQSGRRITVQKDFVRAQAPPVTRPGQFLRALVDRLRAESTFGTILTPDYDAHHYNHLHLDGRQWSFWFGDAA
jgi:hypothetical protein